MRCSSSLCLADQPRQAWPAATLVAALLLPLIAVYLPSNFPHIYMLFTLYLLLIHPLIYPLFALYFAPLHDLPSN